MTSLEETIASYNARISVHLQNIATSEMIINELKTIQDDSGDIEMNRQLISREYEEIRKLEELIKLLEEAKGPG
ncbi:MAG: hypothetical protein AAAC48_14675 [Phyllobacterium sp.]|uniref:hypothetical protein n=1 Tax=Phyllobacterium sp. TaxID=1871046 RepID=UPI0030F26834